MASAATRTGCVTGDSLDLRRMWMVCDRSTAAAAVRRTIFRYRADKSEYFNIVRGR